VNLKEALEQLPVDPTAEERAWAVVGAAYARRERAPVARRRRPLAVPVVAVALVAAAAFSPPGRAVVDAVRRTIGVEHAAPALFKLPAPGRLLVSGSGGAWVVAGDGSKRRLGGEGQASWSPHGLFVVVAGGNRLAAVEPAQGTVRWALSRPGVLFPRWGGTRTDTRIAYLSAGHLRVVAGDGTGDVAIGQAARVAPAWQPERRIVAYATRRGSVAVVDADSKAVLTVHAARGVRELAWSPDGKQLVAVTPSIVHIWTSGGPHVMLRLAGVQAVAFARDGRLALLHGRNVFVRGPDEAGNVFTAPGRLSGLAWAPNGRWLVTSLPSADQWIFVGGRRLRAVLNIAQQFGGHVSLDGWVSGT
jgi:Anaphase-promoting complex subunit 4 WD40 domain/WD domain, G-beta repeat